MTRECEVCGQIQNSGMRHAKRSVCFSCIDKVIEQYISNMGE